MAQGDRDPKADIKAAPDRGESIGLMEPVRLGDDCRDRSKLSDMVVELARRSAGFRGSLPEVLMASLAKLVRAMNCYYSNLIEGHDTHPIDIERALNQDFSKDAKKRNLQLEAAAHIEVQQWIDSGGLTQKPVTVAAIREIHRIFYEAMPADLRWVEDPRTGERVAIVPGELRPRDVKVGNHIAVSPGAVPRFLARFEDVFSQLGVAERVLATAAAHHRLAWIHPFIDGNGRVGRLMAHAILLQALDTGALWSVARGLARNVDEYKSHLAYCDEPRLNDLDGRGNLSEMALVRFTEFFLRVCLDQVAFMEDLMQPDKLRTRILTWAEELIRLGTLPQKSGTVLDVLLYRGEIPRAETSLLLGVGERQARRIVSALADQGAVVSDSPRAPIRLAFPAKLAGRWMPGLFPDKIDPVA